MKGIAKLHIHILKVYTCFVLLINFAYSQNIDSLKPGLKQARHDTIRCELLNQLAEVAPEGEWQAYNMEMKKLAENNLKHYTKKDRLYTVYTKYLASALNNLGFEANSTDQHLKATEYFKESARLQEEIGDKQGVAVSYNNLGQAYSARGDMHKALLYHKKSLELQKEMGDKFGVALSLNSIGYVHENLGDITTALEYFEQALSIREAIGNKAGIASTLNSLAWIYSEQGYNEKAKEYYFRSLKLRQELGDKKGEAWVMNNLGLFYDKCGDKPKAYKCYMKFLKTSEAVGDKEGIAYALNNVATIFGEQGDLRKALSYFERSLKLREEMGDEQAISESLNNIGAVYLRLNNHVKAEEYNLRSMEIAKRLGLRHNIKKTAGTLNDVYKAKGDYKKALRYLELYVALKDTITNQETRKASIRTQLKYEYGKKIAADSIAHAREEEIARIKMAKQESDLSAKKNQQYALYGGLALVLVFGAFMFNRVRVAQKQNKIIEFQKQLVEEKQKEILDSIHYAKRIQRTLLTSERYFERVLARLKG